MKIRTKIGFALLAFVMVFNISCDKSNDDDKLGTDALELPPYESMAVDFSDFLDDSSNSGKLNSTTAKVGGNWLYPRLLSVFGIQLYSLILLFRLLHLKGHLHTRPN